MILRRIDADGTARKVLKLDDPELAQVGVVLAMARATGPFTLLVDPTDGDFAESYENRQVCWDPRTVALVKKEGPQ